MRDTYIYAGKTVKTAVDIHDPFNGTIPAGSDYRIEDYWENVSGETVYHSSMNGNPAARNYMNRTSELDLNSDVLYGKIGFLGFLVHVSELDTSV